jgi:uncharacterized protein YbbC (DUF1343 family)
MKFGIDRLLEDATLRKPLAGKRVALLGHPASVTANLTHSLDALAQVRDVKLSAAFGPQHGMRGDKQDNMVESPDFRDPAHGIPIFSLYGEVRRPTDAMMDTFDVLLVDLQDLGCRIYTFITTLRYVLEAAAKHRKRVVVLDRPNPAGRPIEGLTLRAGWESFVGAGHMPMRHGLTMGELARWFIATLSLDVECDVIAMQGWQPDAAPGFGWPLGERSWVNPSPNAPNLSMARCYDAAARAVRRAGHRRARRDRQDARAGAAMVEGLHLARMLLRADLPQARRQALRRRADPRRRSGIRPSRLQAVAAASGRVQGDPRVEARLSAVARLPVRVRARPSRDRPHQRQRAVAQLGRRSASGRSRSRRDHRARRARLGSRAPRQPALLARPSPARRRS